MTQSANARLTALDLSRLGGFRRLGVDLVKYGAVSAGALALDVGTLLVLNKALGVNYLAAAAVGFTAGLALVYALSVRFVFSDHRSLRPSQEMLGFLVTGLFGLLLNEALMELFVEHFALSVAAAKGSTAGFVFLFNFTARRSLLFSAKADKPREENLFATACSLQALKARFNAFPLWGTIVIALLAAVGFTFSHAQEVWTTGAFFDTDDAMRAVQVRDLLAGQSWFDMTAWRFDPPYGVFTHWSRVVDVPLAALELFFRLFLAAGAAELATRLVFPLALLAALFRLTPTLASVLAPAAPRHLAVLLALLSGATYTQFLPGRIDHHAPQIVLLMATLGLFLRGLDAAKARAMAAASATMALSVAISLENLPFFAVMLIALPTLFLTGGAKMRAPMGWFGSGALIAFPLCFAATVAPARYLLSACDAFSTVYLSSLVVGAFGLLSLAIFAPRLSTFGRRAAAVGLVGAAAIGALISIAPQCVGDPLGGVDLLVRELWLSHVTEATPLLRFWDKTPNVVIVNAVPVLLGLLAALLQAKRSAGLARHRWLIMAGVIAIGFAAGLWQVRVFTSVTPLAMAPLAVPVLALARRIAASYSAFTRALLAGVLCLGVSPGGLASVLPEKDSKAAANDAEQRTEKSCLKPEALGPLAELPRARVAASFDLGPYLLAYTPHSVFAGPYHRANHGNRIIVDAFLAPPEEAEHILRTAGAELVLWCPSEAAGFVKRAPDGLAAALSRGEVPAWLERRNVEGAASLLVFSIR